MRFIADTDTDENCSGISSSEQMQTQLFFFQFLGGHIADKNDVGNNFDFIADTDTEKYYFRIISAMNSDKRYNDQKRPFVHNSVCSHFLEGLGNFGWVFAILFEVL